MAETTTTLLEPTGGPRGRLRGLYALAGWLWAVALEIRRRRRERRLTVAVDISCFYERLTGIGWYLHRLLAQLADRDDVRLRLYGPHPLRDHGPAPVVALPFGTAVEDGSLPTPGPRVPLQRYLVPLSRRLAPLLTAADGNRVLFAPNYLPAPRFRFARGALVATIHDLTIERLPEAVRPDTRVALSRRLDHTFLRATRLITDSAAVRRELIAAGHTSPGRVRAIHLGPGPVADAAAAPPPPAIPRCFALYVGTLEPRKNLPLLLDAWRRLRDLAARAGAPAPPPLVLVGGYGWHADELRRRIDAGVREGWLIHPGYLPVGELAALYRSAELVALPSLYEGFGLPVVEAMVSGSPLVVSDIPVLREVAGDAALYAPPDDTAAWVRQLARLLADRPLAAELVRRGRRRARAFDWRRSAEEHVEVWRGAA